MQNLINSSPDQKNLDIFSSKKIAVLGAGIEGISSALFLKQKGAEVTVLDQKSESQIKEKLGEIGEIRVIGGENYLEGLNQYDMIVRSPGIRLDIQELVEARKKGIEITSQIKLFFDLCPAKIISVTGTKGKGTTSSLIYEMLKKDGKDAYLGGNIGQPPFEFLDKLNDRSWVVLELSSFQLQDLTKSPHIAVMLMIVSEHLNYHRDIHEYVEAKRNLVRFQKSTDYAIINHDYPASNESDICTEGKVFYVSRGQEVKEGCIIKNKEIWLKLAGKDKKIVSASEILLPGEHNLENVCAAVMAAALAGVSRENIVSVLKTFKGLEHRLELVGNVNGVRYYDDSFSTTPETAIAAIQAFEDPEILILGGSSKNSDFSELGRVISEAENIKAIIGVGEEWSRIKSNIKNQISKIRIIEGCKNMREVVQKALEIAELGDIVLLSPACASFDMFKNYKDRGEHFKKEVQNLKLKSQNSNLKAASQI